MAKANKSHAFWVSLCGGAVFIVASSSFVVFKLTYGGVDYQHIIDEANKDTVYTGERPIAPCYKEKELNTCLINTQSS